MNDSKVLRKDIAQTVSLQKEDFTPYALDLGIWDALTGDQNGIGQVVVLVIKKENA